MLYYHYAAIVSRFNVIYSFIPPHCLHFGTAYMPLPSLILTLSLNHRFYSGEITQLLSSFTRLTYFYSSLSHLQRTLQQISWTDCHPDC